MLKGPGQVNAAPPNGKARCSFSWLISHLQDVGTALEKHPRTVYGEPLHIFIEEDQAIFMSSLPQHTYLRFQKGPSGQI